MPLFRGHPLRTLLIAGLLMWSSHRVIQHLPPSLHVFTLSQTSIAVVALAALMLVVVTHRRRQGQVLSQTQEEVLLVTAFALFWFSAFIAYRAYGQTNLTQPHARPSGAGGGAYAPPSPPTPPPGLATLRPSPITYQYRDGDAAPPFGLGNPPPPRYTVRAVQPQAAGEQGVAAASGGGGGGPWPCAGDAVACVVEQWFY